MHHDARRSLSLNNLISAEVVTADGELRRGAAVHVEPQDGMFEDDGHMLADPVGTLQRLRLLGVDRVRMSVRWQTIAPRASVNASSHAGFASVETDPVKRRRTTSARSPEPWA